jgi:hypothetical protein
MAITDKDVIDIVSTNENLNETILTISDHLDWSDLYNHLIDLQEKLNTYIEFIEGGQIYESYPQSKGRRLVIEVVGQYNYPSDAIDFFVKAKPIVRSIGADLRYRVFKER